MRSKTITNLSRAVVVALALVSIAPTESRASKPVPRTVTGCVIKGELVGDPYVYSVRRQSSDGLAPYDLAPHEGRRIRVKGYLLPGDVLVARTVTVVSQVCKRNSQLDSPWSERTAGLLLLRASR